MRKVGFKTVLKAATSDVLDKTTIRYPKGQEAAAKAVQAQVPQAVMEQSAAVTTVTLVLGNNGVQVKSLMPATAATTAPTSAALTSAAATTGTAQQIAAGCIN